MTSRCPVWILLSLCIVTDVTVPQAAEPVERGGTTHKAIPFDQLGAEAQKQYTGDGIGIIPTADGARLRAAFQKLEGQATTEGLWITSTKAEAVEPQNGDAAKGEPEPEPVPDRFRVLATAVGRQEPGTLIDQLTSLPRAGKVTSAGEVVTFTRAGLTEEYRVSMDGVRQDFIIAGRPAGQGKLSVELEITGATAETASYGAKLTLTGSGREIAYSRLHVTDATGRELEATLEVISANRLAVRVQDAGAAYPVRIDPTFSDEDWVSMNPGFPGTNDQVNAAVVDGGGNLYIGGRFTSAGSVANTTYIAKWNGSTWSALGTGMSAMVYALAVNGTDLYAGGAFNFAGGVPASHVAKWNGSTWSALGEGTNSPVNALAVSGGDLYVGGSFRSAGGVANTRHIAKWNGSMWSALGTGTASSVRALAVIGGDLYAGGDFSSAGGVADTKYLAKWDGGSWSALGTGMNSNVYALAVIGTDLYAGGWFSSAGGVANTRRIAKWDGNSWAPLGTGMNSVVYALASNGSDLYAGGEFTAAGGVANTNHVAKWNGSSWSALGTGVNHTVRALVVGGDDLYVGGQFTAADGTANALRAARWNGSSWSALGTGMNNTVLALAVRGSDLYVAGYFVSAGGVVANHVAKWNGSSWSALGSGMTGDDTGIPIGVYALAVSGADLYAGGYFTSAGGVADTRYIAKWNGSSWSALGSGMNSPVAELAVIGADLYAGGSFTLAGGVADTKHIAKWDGSSWSALGTGMNDNVFALAVIGTDLYAGGWFTSAGGVANTNRIAKWNGSTWSALGSGVNNTVCTLVVSGSNLYAGGEFTSAGAVNASHIARWNGSSWSPLGSGTDSTVFALAVNGTDLYAGGGFTRAGAVNANYIARWNGSSWSPLGSGTDSAVLALATGPGSQLFVGGGFTHAGTTLSPVIARAHLPLMPNVDLLGLVTNGGGLSPAFSSDVTQYALTTPAGILTVTPTVAATGATVTVNGTPVASGAASAPIPLTQGANTVTIVVTAQDGVTSKTYTIAATASFPSIEIKTWDNTGEITLSDGGPTAMHIGDAGVGYTNERYFTIGNTGTAPLNVTSVTVDGADPGSFSFIPPPHTPVTFSVPPSGSNSFKVRFSAGHVGGHDAVLHVHTNDPYTPSFDIPVTGNGRVASNGVISIDLPAGSVIDVLERSTDPNFVYIPISRTGGVDGDVGITVATGGGTATPYGDYMPPPLQKTILNQQSQSGVLITIQPTSPPYPYPSEPNETFNVTISNPTGGATLGAVRTVTVRIIDLEDMAPPTPPVINAPALDALVTLTAGAKYLVSGTAKDDKGVDAVQVKLNGSVVGNAALSAPGALSTNWSLLVSPAPDVNTLAVQSTDTQGKTSTEITRTFRAPGPLAVTVNGAHGSVTGGYAPTSIREIGKSYTIKATAKTTPAPGFVFDRWVTGGGYDEGDIGATFDSVRLSTLNFTMRAGLTLEAQFIANPFAAESGAYDGLVRTATGYTHGVATEGHFHVDVQSSGAFSGKLTLDGAAFLVGGAFDNEGVARFGTTRAPSLKFTRTGKRVVEVSLSLGDLDPPGDTADTITGTVTQKHGTTTTGVSDVLMRRAAVPADILAYVPTGSSALYTAVITPQALGSQPAGLTAVDYPQGHSLANITVSRTGGITFVGTMADGTTPVSISSTISKGGDSPLFAQLHGKLGFLSGMLHLDHTQDESDMSAAGMLWAKPYSDIQHYPFGWPEVIKTDLRAARYLVPPTNSVLHAPDDSIAPDSGTRGDLIPAPGANANAQLTFKLPLMADVLKDVKVSTSDGVTKMTTSDASFSLTITRSTGRISGTFTNPLDSSKPAYQGIFYQKGLAPGAYGWFLTLPLAPKVKTYDGQGGSVDLKYQP